MTREQFISLFFLALLIFIIYEIFEIFSPFVNAIFWSAILAFAFYPIHLKIKSWLKPRETVAALLTTLLIFLVVIPPVVVLIINLAAQAIELYQTAVKFIGEGKLGQLIDDLRAIPFIQNMEARIAEWTPLKQTAETWVLNSTRALGNFAAAQLATLTKNVFVVFLNVVLMIVLLFIFLKDGEKIYRFLYDIAPLEEENRRSIFGQINDTFSAVIRGQLLTGLVQAFLAGVVFSALGIPVPILFAVATFITALIPVLGAAAIWLPLVLYLVFQHAYIKAIILFALGAGVISLLDNVLKPAIIGEKTRLPYFLLFFGILGGLKLYGLMGIFLAPVVLSLFFALVKIYQAKYLH
jgi:predicted PurR-regulated permease PerM